MGTSIFTSEPMATRALAAELRHNAEHATALLEESLKLATGELGVLTDVRCESKRRIDVLLVYAADGKERRVGLEAKFDHQITAEQLEREAEVVDHLVLLVLAAEDAGVHADLVDCVITWEQLLATLPDSRLTLDDVRNMPSDKLTVERMFRAQGVAERLFPSDWFVEIRRNGAGMPSIIVQSPTLPDGRELRGQVQVIGRAMPKESELLRLEYHVGVQVIADDDDLPDARECESAPAWIKHLRVLEQLVTDDAGERFPRIARTAAGNGRGARGANKIPLVNKFLDGQTWLAKGYTDGWALGVKSTPTPAGELGSLCDEAAALFLAWFEREADGRAEDR
ncbi:hypothetical protein [Janibacter massiliensis]|uniref:hypothetical protein n=1 Tax=Janibacter massiliensis TaxID=2058291 RepID=UPI000D10CFB5|nr:hypothetical protein [Janibacter massiliensis]